MKNEKLKEKILELRSKGYKYKDIIKELGCAKSTVSYYCYKDTRKTYRARYYKNHLHRKIYKKINTFARSQNIYDVQKITNRFCTIINNKIRQFSSSNEDKKRMFSIKELLEKIGPNPVCYITGDKINLKDTKSWHLDHIVPLSRGGSNELDNAGITTRQANQFKSDNTLDELDILCEKYLTKRGYTITKNTNNAGEV